MPCLESPFDRRQFLFGTAVFATGDCSRLPNSAKDFGSGGVIGSTEKKLGRPWQVLSDCTGASGSFGFLVRARHGVRI